MVSRGESVDRFNFLLFSRKDYDLECEDRIGKMIINERSMLEMAKKSKIAKERKRQQLVAQYAERRRELKANGDYEALRKLPRDSSATRLSNRCEITGRPRGYMSKFKMSRIAFREYAHKGQVPGVKKASW